MAIQLTLFDIERLMLFKSKVKKRVRYKVPTYLKFYSVFQYDRIKFRLLMNDWLLSDEGKNRTIETLKCKQNEILEMCFVRDEKGIKIRDSDEAHIFRIKTLHKIYEAVYLKAKQTKKTDDLIIDDEEKQAELKDTWQMSIKERIKVHIKYLREALR